MKIEDLLVHPDRRALAAQPEADALAEEDALQEAALVDVRLHAIEGRVDVLFDLRSAIQYRMADTSVLVVSGVASFELHRAIQQPAARYGTPYVMSSRPRVEGDWFELALICLGGWRIDLRGRGAEFFVGTVAGLPEAPPNFVEDDDLAIERGMQSWASDLDTEWATFFTGAPNTTS